MSGLGHTHAVYTRAWILLFLGNKRASCYVIFQARGRGDPPWDLQALHPAAVLSGDVHHWDAQICLLAGLPAAPQERWILEKENPLTSPYSLCVGVSMCASLHAACFVSGVFLFCFFNILIEKKPRQSSIIQIIQIFAISSMINKAKYMCTTIKQCTCLMKFILIFIVVFHLLCLYFNARGGDTCLRPAALCSLQVKIPVALVESTLRRRTAQTFPSWRTPLPPTLTVLSSAGWWPPT